VGILTVTDLRSIPQFIINADDRRIIDKIIYPARPQVKYGKPFNEGCRFICLGETGCGKTSLMRVVVYALLAKHWANFALVHDTKGIFPEYRHSIILANVAEFVKRGSFRNGDIPIYSFRGNPRADIDVTAEEVARFSLHLARLGLVPHATVIEELAEASTAGRKHIKAPSVLKLAEQGRKMGVSLVGTTQSPRKTPLDLLGQASAIAFFRLTGADANYLEERLDLDPAMVAAIRGPNSVGLTNHHYVLYIKGETWDGQIHKLNERTAMMFE